MRYIFFFLLGGLVVACAKNEAEKYTLTLKAADSLGNANQDIAIGISKGTNGLTSKDGEFNSLKDELKTNSSGTAAAKIEPGYLVIGFTIPTIETFPTMRVSAFANFTKELDFSTNPTYMFKSTDSAHYCDTILRINTGTSFAETTKEAWLRIYKSNTSEHRFAVSDTLTIAAVDNGAAEVNSSTNVVTSTTAGQSHLDVYYASSASDSVGHKNTSIRGKSSGLQSHYDVTLNGTTLRVQMQSCSKGVYTVVYF